MAYSATFKYNNLDATTDLNLPTRILSAPGVVSGFGISPVAGTANITVAPGYLVSRDGMIVQSTASTTLAMQAGILNYVVFRAVYNSPADPTLSIDVLSQSNYASDAHRQYLVLLGTVNLTAVTQVSNNVIDYSLADQVDVQARDNFLGVFDNAAALQLAYPSTVPTAQRNGDYALVLVDTQSKPALYIWIAGSGNWLSFGNYEDLLLNFNVHVAGVATAGVTAHLTAAEKSAITGTYGTPGALNRFVTETDVNLLISATEKAAIDNAITGPNPLSFTNPLVADGIPVAVQNALGVTTTSDSDYLQITYGDLGTGVPFFGVAVFTGKLGLDDNGISTARNWFKIQDEFLAGYADSDGPIYVTDVLTGDGAGSFNPGADTNVSNIGYWKGPTGAPGTAIRLKFNRVLPSGKTIYVAYYAQGSISKLAPQNAYKLPSTALSTSRDSYREINTARITTILADAGSPASPSYTFVDSSNNTTHSGLYYVGDVTDSHYSFHSAVGVAVNGSSVLVVATSTSTETLGDPSDVPFIIEQVYPDPTDTSSSSTLTYRLHAYRHASGEGTVRIAMGVSSYSGGFSPSFYITGNGTQFEKNVTFSTGVQLVAAAGTAAAPGLAIGGASTGWYGVGSYVGPKPSFYNSVGLTLNGRTAFVFGTNDSAETGLSAGLESPLLFEEVNNSAENTIDYRIAIVQASSGDTQPGSIYFGRATYNIDFSEYGHFDKNGNLYVTGSVYADSVYSGGSGSTLGYLSVTSSGLSLMYDGTARYSFVESTNATTITSATTTITGTLKIVSGTETAPGLTFSGDTTGTGLYYAGWVTGDSDTLSKHAVGVSVQGETVLLVGRSEEYSGGLNTIQAPLVIDQHVIDTSNVELRISGTSRTGTLNTTLAIGTSTYSSAFIPAITIDTNSVEIALNTTFDRNVTAASVTASGAGHFGSVISGAVVRAVGAAANNVAFDVGTSNGSGLYGSDSSLGLARGGTAYMTLTGGIGGSAVNVAVNFTVAGTSAFTGTSTFTGATTFNGHVTGADATWSGTSTFTGAVNIATLILSDLSLANLSVSNTLSANIVTFVGGATANGDLTWTGNLSLTGSLGVTGPITSTQSININAGSGFGLSLNDATGVNKWLLTRNDTQVTGVEHLYLYDDTSTLVFAIPSYSATNKEIVFSRDLHFNNSSRNTISALTQFTLSSSDALVLSAATIMELDTPRISSLTGSPLLFDVGLQAPDFNVPASTWHTSGLYLVSSSTPYPLTLTSPRTIIAVPQPGVVSGSDTNFFIGMPKCSDGSCLGVKFTILLPHGNSLWVHQHTDDDTSGIPRLSQGNGSGTYVQQRGGSSGYIIGPAINTVDIVTITGAYYMEDGHTRVYCWIFSA
jgi:hypothetical protein